jgi:hypothetical protein
MDLSGLTWRKSSYSGSNGGTECVEVAVVAETAAVRDSKNPDHAALTFPARGWATFLTVVRGG